MKARRNNTVKTLVDACMTVLLLLLMAYQVTGEALHEWFGVGMTALLIVHHILNRKWYAALFKGKYSAYRIVALTVNALLLVCAALTALCGMAMSARGPVYVRDAARLVRAAFSSRPVLLVVHTHGLPSGAAYPRDDGEIQTERKDQNRRRGFIRCGNGCRVLAFCEERDTGLYLFPHPLRSPG